MIIISFNNRCLKFPKPKGWFLQCYPQCSLSRPARQDHGLRAPLGRPQSASAKTKGVAVFSCYGYSAFNELHLLLDWAPPPSRVLGQGLRSRFGFASRRAVGGKIFYFWFGGFDRPAGCCETQRCNSSGALDEDSLAKPYLPKPRSHFCGCLSNQLWYFFGPNCHVPNLWEPGRLLWKVIRVAFFSQFFPCC